MRKTHLLFVACAVAASTAASGDARALGPLTLEIGAKGGFGSNPDGSQPINPLGGTIGGRAGISIFGFYGGIDGEYFFGGSSNFEGVNYSEHTVKYGGQLGYNLGIPFITLRPEVGVGNIAFSFSSDSGTIAGIPVSAASSSNSSIYVEPGIAAILTFGTFFIGADVNALLIPSYPEATTDNPNATSFKASVTAHGQLGVSF